MFYISIILCIWYTVAHKNFLISAVKCNDSLIVIEVLAALGINFDCASKVNMIKY